MSPTWAGASATPRRDETRSQSPSLMPSCAASSPDLHEIVRRRFLERPRTAGLGTGMKVVDKAARRQQEGIFLIRLFGRREIIRSFEDRAPVRLQGAKLLLVPGRAGVEIRAVVFAVIRIGRELRRCKSGGCPPDGPRCTATGCPEPPVSFA